MSVEKSFPIYGKTHASGNIGYRVDMGFIGGKRVFKSFPTKEAAERFQRRCLEAEAKKKPVDLRDLNDVTRHEVLSALAKLREHNATIAQAVDFYLKHARPAKANATIGEVMDQFKGVKVKSGRSNKYIDTAWSSFFVPFRDHFKNCEIGDVTSDACERCFYQSKTWTSTTRRSHLRHVSVLFNFAVDRGYAGINPIRAVETPKKPAGTSRKRVVSVENVIKLLRYANEHGYKQECAALVLILFCGVRVDEVARLTWDDIKLDEDSPVVTLGEDQTKTGKTRINPIPDNAMDWLKMLRAKGSNRSREGNRPELVCVTSRGRHIEFVTTEPSAHATIRTSPKTPFPILRLSRVPRLSRLSRGQSSAARRGVAETRGLRQCRPHDAGQAQ